MSSDLNSIAELPQEAVVLVLQLLARTFSYGIFAFTTLVNFPKTSSSLVKMVDKDLSSHMARWKNRRELINNYVGRIEQLSNHEEMMVVFNNLWDFVRPQIINLLDEVKAFNSSNGGPYNDIKTHLYQALFTDSNCVTILKFLAEESLVDLLSSLTPQTLDRFHIPDSFELTQKTVLQVNGAIESTGNIHKLDRSAHSDEALQKRTIKCFELAIDKEIAFDPKEDPKLLANIILSRISKNEQGDSPNSFDDEQCRILDFQQLFTFHCSSVYIVYDLAVKSMTLTIEKVKYYVPNTRHPVYLQIGSLVQLRDRTFPSWLDGETLIEDLVLKGTIGLSQWDSVFMCISFVQKFTGLLRLYSGIHNKALQDLLKTPRSIPDLSLLKEEDHFVKVLEQYREQLCDLVLLITQTAHPKLPLEVNIDLAQLEELDLTIKDTYYTLAYFDQRFGYEFEIMETMLGREIEMFITS